MKTTLLIQTLFNSIKNINESKSLLIESAKSEISNITSLINTPYDVKNFVSSNEIKVKNTIQKMQPKHIPLYKKAWNCLKYASMQTFNFIKKHWKKIIMLIILIVLAWISYTIYSRYIDVVEMCSSAAAAGEYLQQYDIKNGQKPISDGWAHFINQLNDLR